MSGEAEKVGTVSNTTVLASLNTVQVESGGRSFAWSPDDAEQVAGLLLRAARTARAKGGCMRDDDREAATEMAADAQHRAHLDEGEG